VLAIYAARATTSAADPLDAITLDERRRQLLREGHEEINVIGYRVKDRQCAAIVAVEQPDGTITEATQVYTRRTLCITQPASRSFVMGICRTVYQCFG
jgi:hypothetical protein